MFGVWSFRFRVEGLGDFCRGANDYRHHFEVVDLPCL